MHRQPPVAADDGRNQPNGDGGDVDECAVLRQQLSAQQSRIERLEAALAAKAAQEADTAQQLSVSRALLLLRNIEAAQNHYASVPAAAAARDSSGNATMGTGIGTGTGTAAATTTYNGVDGNSSSSSSSSSRSSSTGAVAGAALAAASLEALVAPQSLSEARISQLRRVKLLKHSWRLLREDAQRLQRGIPKIGKWVSTALDDALALHAARHAELQRKLQQLAELFES